MARSNQNSEFAERITWPMSLWLFLALMLASIYLTFWAPFNALVATIICLLILVSLIYAQYKTRLEIVVINNWLYVDNAKIELKYIKSAKCLDKVSYLKLRGQQADPAAFNATRFWIKTGVKIMLNDKSDPTPYWIISSKKAKALADCLN
ncbi:MAG: DUF3093 domain-containing protein [Candidatus Nanopelagicus sp.]